MILYIQASLKNYYHDDIPESVVCTTSALTCLITATHITEGPDGELLAAVHLGPTGTDHRLIIENY